MIRTDRRMRMCTVLVMINLLFIWGNSLLPGSVSGAISDWVKAILQGFFEGEASPSSGGFLLRKAAHFSEFTCLGILLTWLFSMLGKKKFLPLLCGIAAACIDETIQRFVPDRGPSIRDVGIDSGGVLFGICLLCLLHTLFYKRKQFTEET